MSADALGGAECDSTAGEGAAVTSQLLNLLSRVSLGSKQVHGAKIVATMLAYGIPRLLTHNTADFARFSGPISIVPL